MKTNNRTSIIPAILVAIISLAGLQTSQAAQPKVDTVTVNNTATNPVPVEVQNPVTNVSVNNTAANPLPVNIQNPLTNVTVKAADNPAFQPYHRYSQEVEVDIDSYEGTFAFDVPAGKRLVIELVTVYARLPSGQSVSKAKLETVHANNAVSPFFLTASFQANIGDGSTWAITQPLRAYADAGASTVKVTVQRNNLGGGVHWFLEGSISGYLVDLP